MNINQKDYEKIRQNLKKWGKENFRNFSWRNSTNSFHILIAEIMLQRTKAEQVMKIYDSFISKYPDPFSILNLSNEELMKELRPLGLNWRIINIKKMCEELVNNFNGIVPKEYNKLLSLPGVGPYIAGAVMCIAFDKKTPLLDTNLVRVISRMHNVVIKESLRRDKNFLKIIEIILPEDKPKEILFSMLDHANYICKIKPACSNCPINIQCDFYDLIYLK